MSRSRPVSPLWWLVLLALPWVSVAPATAQSLPQQVQDLVQPEQEEGEAGETTEEGERPPGEQAEEQEGGLEEKLRLPGDPLSASFWRQLKEKLAEDLVPTVAGFIPNLIKALLVLLLVFVAFRLVHRLLDGLLRRTKADPGARSITLRLTRWVILTLGLIVAASQLGFQVTSLLTGLGILGLVVGLAAQDSLANLIAGLIILFDRPFRIGDNVTIAETFGQVKEIGLRTTRILTVEHLDAILPNKEVINQKIVNHTLNPQLRLPIKIGIAYKEDSREARRVLLDKIRGHPLLREEPEPRVVVTGLGESSVDLEIRVWLKDPHAEREALFEITELAKIALDEAGIEIPFPQRTLHFGSAGLPVRLERASEAADVE